MPLYVPEQQGAPLALLALPVVGDEPPAHGLQRARLRDGVHLRWAFKRSYDPETGRPRGGGFPDNPGFPYFGFYLLRRLSPLGGATECASVRLRALGLPPGPLPSPTLPLSGFGTFQSDANLVLTETFAPGDTREIDLEGRSFVRLELDPAQPCRVVEVTIGFVADVGQAGGSPGGSGGVPGHADDCACGACVPSVRPVLERVVRLGNGAYRASFGYESSTRVPVSVPVGARNQFHPDPSDRGQPRLFRPGRVVDAFFVEFDGRTIAWTLDGKTVTASASDVEEPGAKDGIVITAFRSGSPVATRVVGGKAGQVVTVPVIFDAIDAVSVSGAPARLVDMCLTRLGGADLQSGWAPVPNLTQPICLPVFHQSYPCNRGDVSESASWEIARARIKFGSETEWVGTPFSEIHTTLVEIVQSGPQFITDFFRNVPGVPDSEAFGEVVPEVDQLSSLDLLLLAAVDPAAAQMLGLYFIDETAVEGQIYDYLIVGDYNGGGQGNVNNVLARVAAGDYTSLHAYLRSGVRHGRSPALSAPNGVNGYALPLSAIPFGSDTKAVGSVGLTWSIAEREGRQLASEAPVLYHLWRAVLSGEPFAPPEGRNYSLALSSPIAAGTTRTEPPAQPIAGWPPFSLYAIDDFLPEGWYSYALSGIDVFGRHSDVGPPGNWLDWTAPDPPLNEFAVNVLDKSAPPAPTEVRAWALDPGDPLVIADDLYDDWRDAVGPSVVGLRVRWVWTGMHELQAPDTREFRVYIDLGSSKQNAADPTSWNHRLLVVPYGQNVLDDGFAVREFEPDRPFTGDAATVNGSLVTLDGDLSLADIAVDGTQIELEAATGQTRFTILGVDPNARTLTVAGSPVLGGSSSPWAIGIRQTTYEIFYPPAPGQGSSIPLAPSDAEPVVYGLVGVSAADDKAHVHDRPGIQGFGDRFGNEGAVGGPAGIFLVLRAPPAPLNPVEFGDELFATRADFYSRSFFTLHWQKQVPGGHLSAHVYRVLDETLFAVDGQNPFPRTFAQADLDKAYPPTWNTARRNNARNDLLQKLTTPAGYATITNDALRVLAGLPSNAAAFTRLTRAALPPDTLDEIGPSDVGYQPQNEQRGAYRDTLDGRANNRYFYRVSYVNRAHSEGALGVATPPVRVVFPGAIEVPILENAVGGDRAVTLSLVASRSPNVVHYSIYRAATREDAGSLRAMELLETIIDDRPPAQRTTPLPVTDNSVIPYRDYFYRATATFPEGESQPTPVFSARAFDASPPPEPVWERSEWVKLDADGNEHPFAQTGPDVRPALALRFRFATGTTPSAIVQALGGTVWVSVTGWLSHPTVDTVAGTTTFSTYVLLLSPAQAQALRVRAVSAAGLEHVSAQRIVAAP